MKFKKSDYQSKEGIPCCRPADPGHQERLPPPLPTLPSCGGFCFNIFHIKRVQSSLSVLIHIIYL